MIVACVIRIKFDIASFPNLVFYTDKEAIVKKKKHQMGRGSIFLVLSTRVKVRVRVNTATWLSYTHII